MSETHENVEVPMDFPSTPPPPADAHDPPPFVPKPKRKRVAEEVTDSTSPEERSLKGMKIGEAKEVIRQLRILLSDKALSCDRMCEAAAEEAVKVSEGDIRQLKLAIDQRDFELKQARSELTRLHTQLDEMVEGSKPLYQAEVELRILRIKYEHLMKSMDDPLDKPCDAKPKTSGKRLHYSNKGLSAPGFD